MHALLYNLSLFRHHLQHRVIINIIDTKYIRMIRVTVTFILSMVTRARIHTIHSNMRFQ